MPNQPSKSLNQQPINPLNQRPIKLSKRLISQLLNHYFPISCIKQEMTLMQNQRAAMLSGTITPHQLLECCVNNRHFRFLHLKKGQGPLFINHVAKKLLAVNILNRSYVDFEDLYDVVKGIIGKVPNIGPLMLYDITRMIGYALNPIIVPQAFVYLQQGSKVGARNLLSVKRLPYRVCIGVFKNYFPGIGSQYIEDILCIYKHCFKNGSYILPNRPCNKPNVSSCNAKRRNPAVVNKSKAKPSSGNQSNQQNP